MFTQQNLRISNVIKIMYHQHWQEVTYLSYQNIAVGLRWIYVMFWPGITENNEVSSGNDNSSAGSFIYIKKVTVLILNLESCVNISPR